MNAQQDSIASLQQEIARLQKQIDTTAELGYLRLVTIQRHLNPDEIPSGDGLVLTNRITNQIDELITRARQARRNIVCPKMSQ